MQTHVKQFQLWHKTFNCQLFAKQHNKENQSTLKRIQFHHQIFSYKCGARASHALNTFRNHARTAESAVAVRAQDFRKQLHLFEWRLHHSQSNL